MRGGRHIPQSIFLLGPNQWDDDIHVPTPLWVEEALSRRPDPFTPKHLRDAAAALIEAEDPARQGIVMDPDDQRDGESDGEFFNRLEDRARYRRLLHRRPDADEVLGTVFEGGMLERDFHYGHNPKVLLFLEEGFARSEDGGTYTFTAKGKRTRYLVTLAERAHHVHLWETFEELTDRILTWALVDD